MSGVRLYLYLGNIYRRTSSVGKVDESKSEGPRFKSCNKPYEKNLLVLLTTHFTVGLCYIVAILDYKIDSS